MWGMSHMPVTALDSNFKSRYFYLYVSTPQCFD